MGQETLSSILHVRYGLRMQCKDFQPTNEMLQQFNSRMYLTREEENKETDDDDLDVFECF